MGFNAEDTELLHQLGQRARELADESQRAIERAQQQFLRNSVAGHPQLDRGPDGPRYPHITCYVCEGEGMIWEDGEMVTCPECDGTGYDNPYDEEGEE